MCPQFFFAFCFFSDSAKEANNDVKTFLNLEFFTTQ